MPLLKKIRGATRFVKKHAIRLSGLYSPQRVHDAIRMQQHQRVEHIIKNKRYRSSYQQLSTLSDHFLISLID